MNSFDIFNRAVSNMMSRFGTDATVVIVGDGVYNPTTSEYVKTDSRYNVKAIFADLLKPKSGDTSRRNTLIEEGDKQVYIQPQTGTKPLPTLQANRDTLEINGKVFKLVYVKQLNTTLQDCIMYECYCRE